MPRNRKISKSEYVISSGQLSFTAELEKKREKAKVFLEILMKDHVRNLKYVKTQIKFGDVNEDIKKRTLTHIDNVQEWLTEVMDKVNLEYRVYGHFHKNHFESLHISKAELEGLGYLPDPFESGELSEMLLRAISRLRSFYAGYDDILQPSLTDYVKGTINHLKRAYLAIK